MAGMTKCCGHQGENEVNLVPCPMRHRCLRYTSPDRGKQAYLTAAYFVGTEEETDGVSCIYWLPVPHGGA